MTGKTGLTAVIAAATLGLAGCATCHHKAVEVALCPPACPDTCLAQRNRVHVFLVNGVDPLDDGGLIQLRDRLNVAGFTQVYHGHPHHTGWFGRTMRRIACDDPHARFVIVGYESGAGNAVTLAADAGRHGLPVDAVVLLDPASVSPSGCAAVEAPIHLVTSDRWKARDDLPVSDAMKLPDVGHYTLASHPATVEHVTSLLLEAVARVPHDDGGVPVLPMFDEPAPVPFVIPDTVKTPAKPGGVTRRLSPPAVNPWAHSPIVRPASHAVTRP
jgi:hypothetical protein